MVSVEVKPSQPDRAVVSVDLDISTILARAPKPGVVSQLHGTREYYIRSNILDAALRALQLARERVGASDDTLSEAAAKLAAEQAALKAAGATFTGI